MSDAVNPFAAPQANIERPPEQTWAIEQPQAMRKVKRGLTLVYTGIILGVLTVLGFGVLAVMLNQSPNDLAWAFAGVIGAFAFAGILIIVGQVYCRAIPAETNSRRLVDTSLACHGLSAALIPLALFLPATMVTELGWLLQFVSNALTPLALAAFTLFMRRVALFIHRRDVAGRATRTLVVGGISTLLILVAVGLALLGVTAIDAGQLQFAAGIGGIGFFVALIMYANTVTYLRKAITV